MKTVIRQAQVFRDGNFQKADLVIDGEKIAEIAPSVSGKFEQEIDASGLSLFPGLIDVHVHFRDPGLEHKEGWLNGSRAAARGGVSCVFEIQNNEPLSVDASRIQERFRRASQGLVDFGCYGNLLPQSVSKLKEMAPLVPAFKLFMGGSTGMDGIPDRKLLKDLFAAAADSKRPIVAHCEDENILLREKPKAANATARDHHRLRPAEAESSSVQMAVELVKETGAVLHVFHLSTAKGTELVAQAKKVGLPISASVSPHHLILSCEDAERLGNYIKVNPAIQTPQDRQRLREGVRSGEIEVIATDHAPHMREEKDKAYPQAPAGIPSVEFLLPLVLSLVDEKVLSLSRAIDSLTLAPATIFGVQGKGKLAPGYDADFVLIDLSKREKIRQEDIVSRAGWSPFIGREIPELPRMNFVRGKAVWNRGKFFEGAWGKPVRLKTL